MALKIAIVPVMLLSILWRNRLEKRRRAEATEQQQLARSARAKREVFDLPATDISGMQMALDRLRNGACLVSPRNEPVTEPMLRGALAAALMDDGRFDDAAEVVGDVDGTDDPNLTLCIARLELHKGNKAKTRLHLSHAADAKLTALRQASRGVRLHLAELLAQTIPATPAPLSLQDTRLSGLGPLECLILSGRTAEAQQLTGELVALLQTAVAESDVDPQGRAGPLPRHAAQSALARLSSFSEYHFTLADS